MIDWIVTTIADWGYPGIALLMFLENLFPPIPSEVIMPLAGFTAARGEMSLPGVLLAGAAGSVLGALPWYYAGRRLGAGRLARLAERHGRWLTLSRGDLERSDAWFGRHGAKAVLFGRLLPALRTLISVPAGIARMRPVPFLLYSTLGATLWSALLTYAGWLLDRNYALVAEYLGPLSKLAVGLLAAVYVYRVLTFGRRRRR